MRQRFFSWLGKTTSEKYWLVLIVGLVATVMFGYFAEHIRIDATWMSLLPQDSKSVKSFQNILDEFGAATNIVMAIEGPDKERIIEVVDSIIVGLDDIVIEYTDDHGALIQKNAFKRIEHKYDQEYLKQHGFMLEKAKNLKKNKIMFTDYNLVPFLTHINDVFETQWVSDADNHWQACLDDYPMSLQQLRRH